MKIKYKIFKITAIILTALSLLCNTIACNGEDVDTTNATKLSFKATSGYDYLKTLNGTTVTISGYMATSSPVDGSFMFLMNLPYQSCPFCVPNTTQLSNTMEVYPKKGDSFDFTNQAIKVVGTLQVCESEDEPFTDKYGYKFCCKIVDATYTIIKAEDLSSNVALWQKIASTDVINEIYQMYDYLHFVCNWNTYYINSYTDENGETFVGYYLFPSDAKDLIYTKNAQFNYGYKDGYFTSIIEQIEKVDKTAFSDLVVNVKKAEALSKKALDELEQGNYTAEYKYLDRFNTYDYYYTLTKGEELNEEMQNIYTDFSNWLGSWEM